MTAPAVASAPLRSIGELAAAADVATSTLRYYDEIGLLTPTDRRSGRRWYGPEAARRLGVIRACQQAGFSLEEIARLLDGDQDWRPLAEAKLAELEARLAGLDRARRMVVSALACQCRSLDGCDQLDAPDPAHRAPEAGASSTVVDERGTPDPDVPQ